MKIRTTLAITILAAFTVASCNNDEHLQPGPPKVPLELVISNVGDSVVAPTTKKFHTETKTLERELKSYCQYINDSTTLTKQKIDNMRQEVQVAWKNAMRTYHVLEMMQYGPVKEPLSTTMPSLYTFDTNSKCKAEIFIARRRKPNYAVTDESEYKLVGLDTLEAFLFTDPEKSQCPASHAGRIRWQDDSLRGKQVDICNYMVAIAEKTSQVSQDLMHRWQPTSGSYSSQILTQSVLGSPQNAINEISQSLFHLYGGVVDFKVTVPAGIQVFNDRVQSCSKASCPESTEHIYSQFSVESLHASLQGFYYVFNGINPQTGQNGASFDDILIEQGHEATVNKMNSALNVAKNNLKRWEGKASLTDLAKNVIPEQCQATTSQNRLVEICAINADIKQVTDTLLLMESQLKSLLSRPASVSGDND